MMNIGALAKSVGVSVDTLRFYEKQGLLKAAQREANGYRCYGPEALTRVRFIRGAQTLGFSLTQIKATLQRLEGGGLSREDIEEELRLKIAQVDEKMAVLRALKKELKATFAALTCAPGRRLSTPEITHSKP